MVWHMNFIIYQWTQMTLLFNVSFDRHDQRCTLSSQINNEGFLDMTSKAED